MTNDPQGKVVMLFGSPVDNPGDGTAQPEAPNQPNVQSVLIKPFMTHFGKPKVDDLAAYLADWTEAFAGLDMSLLATAVARTIRYRRSKTWPPMGEVTDNVNAAVQARESDAARREAAASTRKVRDQEAGRVPHTPDSKARVKAAKDACVAALAEADLGRTR